MCDDEGVTTPPPEESGPVLDQSAGTPCYAHPKIHTKLRCSRCERPICGRCAIPASVGQHCPECVAEARKSAPRVRSTLEATAPAVRVILGTTIAFYVLQQLYRPLTGALASFPPATASGELWRLITPILLHGSIIHIGLNMYILYVFGPTVEQAFGSLRFVAVYLISGFMGTAASYAFSSCRSLGVGASGAIFGLAGVLFVYAYKRRGSELINLQGIRFFIIANLVFGVLVNLTPGPFSGIDNFAHLGGLAGGSLLGLSFDRPAGSRTTIAAQVLAAVAVVGLGVALVAYRTATFTC